MRICLLLLSLSASACASLGGAVPDARALGRKLQRQLEASDAKALWPRLSPAMQQLFGSRESMKQKLDEIRQKNGAETRLGEESVQFLADGYKYGRRAMFERRYMQFNWWLDDSGQITGLRYTVAPFDELAGEARTRYAAYQTKTPLHLPFHGVWRVGWGGRTVKENYHAASLDQRFAYDLGIVKSGSTHDGDGSLNEQYYCFGQPIIAPGAGKAIEVADGIEDNRPREMPGDHPCGNHVLIDHGNGEFSLLCHLQKGSLAVETGALVKAGELLGKCGNSGHSSEPHLHYQLQDTARPFDGEGMPAQFLDVKIDGKQMGRAELRRGQMVSGD